MAAISGFIWAFPSFYRRSGYFAAGTRIKTSCLEFLTQGEIPHLFSEAVHLSLSASYTGTGTRIQIRQQLQ
jgi:hypothetical protein